MWHDGPVPAELGRFPGYLMSRLGQRCAQRFAESLEPSGASPRLFGVMSIVAAHPGLTQQQLHRQTAIDTSSMVALIDELEQRGLAERRMHSGDRRARAIHLTEAGQALMDRLRAQAGAVQGEMFAALTADELHTLHGLLRKLAGVPRAEPPA